MSQIHLISISGVLAATCALGTAQAGGIGWLFDDFDNPLVVGAVQDQDAVKQFRKGLDKLKDDLRRKNQREIEQLLCKPEDMPRKTYAIPVAQARRILLSGFAPAANKRHKEFYPIKDVGGLEVWYGSDGESPELVVVRLKVDKNFPRVPDLSPRNLAARLAWERERFDKLVKFVEQREKEAGKEKKNRN